MFCPNCGSTQPDDLNYCKACGANLQAVRGAMLKKGAPEDAFDWNKTWLAEMLLSHDELDRRKGKTAEIKRRNEIKAGVITASTGAGLTVVLSVLMDAIVVNGHLSALAADILSRIWIVGLIPIMVGLALIFNGVVIGRKRSENVDEMGSTLEMPGGLNTNELPPAHPFSVTDNTTRHLDEAVKLRRDG